MASQARVAINLSEQKAYLVEPIFSGKRGWSTPRRNFRL
jgi:hypothetical protein